MILSETLRNFSLFADLDPTFVEELATISDETALQKGIWLFREGDAADALYLIVSGSVDLKMVLDEKGQIYADLSTLTEGNALGWSVFIEPYIYKFGAMTASNTQLLKIEGKQLRALMERHPEQGYVIMQGIAQGMASRLQTVRAHGPELSMRLVLSRAFTILAYGTGLLTALIALGAIVGGDAATVLFSVLCALIPIGCVIVARVTYPATEHV